MSSRNVHRQGIWLLLIAAVSAPAGACRQVAANGFLASSERACPLGFVLAGERCFRGQVTDPPTAQPRPSQLDRMLGSRPRMHRSQLDNGTTDNADTAVPVTGLSAVKSIHAGGGHACAVLNSGAVRCWGDNTYGQLGNGTFGTDAVTTLVLALRM